MADGEEAQVTDAYTVFWTMDQWLGAVAVGHKPLPVMFGGPHRTEPSFRQAGVRVGDMIYPIAVSNRHVFVVARMRVREMLLLGQEDGPSLIEQRFPQYRSWKFLAPTCTEEVIVGMEGTVARSDLELPAEVLDRLTFRSARGERPLKQVKDGELTSTSAIRGIYRLSTDSAAELANLVETAPPASAAWIPRPGWRRGTTTPEEALF
jgi:hypothetical protein